MAELVTILISLAVIGAAFAIAMLTRDDSPLWPFREKFEKVYPPISDEEFIQRLSPEVPPEIGLKVRELLVELTGVRESQIYPEAGLLELMGDAPPRFDATPPVRNV